MDAPALYIHIPFCARKCAYCDFASWAGKQDVWEAYFDALEAELDSWNRVTGGIYSTAFFGGGTPSLVPAEHIVRIAGKFRAGECTLEANPGTLTPEKLRIYRNAGINRLSMGVQSFDDGLLRLIGRIHTSDEAEAAFRMARDAGFDNVNLDLMYALPGQTMEQWRATLERAVRLNPEHISAYSLILEEGTPLAEWAEPLPDETVNAMQRAATHLLAEAGYGRYEISNYAKPGRECAHNLTYWNRGDYIGVGCAAHSLYQGRRFSNPAPLEEYLAGTCRVDEEILTGQDILEETLFLGLRTTRGVPRSVVPNAGAIPRLREAGFLREEDGFIALTEQGMEVQDAIVLELLG